MPNYSHTSINPNISVSEAKEGFAATIDNQGFDYAITQYGDVLQEYARLIPNSERLIQLLQEAEKVLSELEKEIHKHGCHY